MRSSLQWTLACTLLSLVGFAQNAPPTQPRPMVPAVVTVPAKIGQNYPFKVLAGFKQVHLVGQFRAAGSARNDIAMLVMNDKQFANWLGRNNHVSLYFKRALYDSQKVAQGTVNLNLPADPATYNLVFYNGSSRLEAIEVTFKLGYVR
jgi:hypothetical protein